MKGMIVKLVVLAASAFVLGAAKPRPIVPEELRFLEPMPENGTDAGEYSTIERRDGRLNCGNFACK